MAWAKLATTFRNLDRPAGREHAARALEGAERLLPRERHYVEGLWASYDVRRWPQAIEAFERAVEIDPRHYAARQNLAVMLSVLERYDESVEHGEALVSGEAPYRGSYATLAESYSGRGDLERAEDLLQKMIRRRPDDFVGRCALGRLYRRWGKLDDALASFTLAESLQPGTAVNFAGLCSTHLLRGEWRAALDLAAEHERLTEPALKVATAECRMLAKLYRGHSTEALAIAEELTRWIPISSFRASARLRAGRIHRARGELEAALRQTRLARQEGRGHLVEGQALFSAARAELELGRLAAAGEVGEELRILAEVVPGVADQRRYHHLRGLAALAEGRTGDALAELEEAASLLGARGIRTSGREPDHVPLWASLAKAHREAGHSRRAADYLERIVESSEERVGYPAEYVKSLYLLGELREEEGDAARARHYYELFLAHWKDGDLARPWVSRLEAAGISPP